MKTYQEGYFRVWAPKAKSLSLVILNNGEQCEYPMESDEEGFYTITLSQLPPNVDYCYKIDGDKIRPDPASRWQPNGVHAPSRLYNQQTFEWNDHSWKGININDYLIYELHVGTFTPQGTFEAVIDKLPYLQKLGITAIELMPIIEFPGEHNWGYDGVYPYAPHHAYGGPEGLKRLIDACHEKGFAVILDVVYNHLGPEGNYLGDFGYYYTDHHKTPWGQAINFDGPYSDFVRQYFIDNALYWLTEYHIDALRLDAIQKIYDFGARHFLEELHLLFQQQAQKLGRQAYTIAESDLNDLRVINPVEKGGYAIDAQWNDDFHHSLHVLLTKNQWRYFSDYGDVSHLAKAIANGFVYEGQWSQFRKKRFGSSSTDVPGNKFVVYIQNHDQIGNGCQGKSLGTLVSPEKHKMAAMVLFCTPNIPLIFMGQEWNAMNPFLFFTSFEDEKLIESVRDGYKREFEIEIDDPSSFDPQDPKRWLQSKLQWEELEQSDHQAMFSFYQKLIGLRKELKCLSNASKEHTVVDYYEGGWLVLKRSDPDGSKAVLFANFAEIPQFVQVCMEAGKWALSICNNTMEEGEAFSECVSPSILDLKGPSIELIPIRGWTALLYTLENRCN